MKNFDLRTLSSLIIILILISIDQFSKIFFIDFLATQPGYVLDIGPFFSIVHTWNYGISFGLFNQYQKYSNIIFLISNSLIILYLLANYIIDDRSHKLYLLVISGGIGNLLDRVMRGAVFDFILLHYDNYYFPVFNFADILISGGIFWFIIEIFFIKKNKQIK